MKLLCLLIFLMIVQTQTHLAFNHTLSLPYKAFLCVKGLKPQKGDLVSIQGHETTFFKNTNFTKRLTGLPGDQIKPLPLKKLTKDKQPLHPTNSKIVPEGYVFVTTDHPYSFDSRYQEFGLVKQEHICGKCVGLWKC